MSTPSPSATTLPSLLWVKPDPIVAGTPLTGTQLNAGSNVPGTFTYDPPLGTVLGPGSGQILTLTFDPLNSATYSSVTLHVTLDVIQPPPAAIGVGQTTFSNVDGRNPVGGLMQARDGRLWGTTAFGGSNDSGTIFAMTAGGPPVTMHHFAGTDGFRPLGTLLEAVDGHIYGTTYGGGASGFGTIFSLDETGALTTLHAFNGSDGAYPRAGLLQASDGRFYGTTQTGGAGGYGTIFALEPGGGFTTLFSFDQTNGSYPGVLVQAFNGLFYGTTYHGGTNDGGTAFVIDRFGAFQVLFNFSSESGTWPVGGLVLGTDGLLYGAASQGGQYGNGTLFTMTGNGQVVVIHTFGGAEGTHPATGLIQALDGHYYGTTRSGANGFGTVFRIDGPGTLTTLHSFASLDGAHPIGDLVQTSDGRIYGTTTYGGTADGGGVFRLPTVLWSPLPAITYGTALGAGQLNAQAALPGSFVYTPSSGTILGAGTHTLSASFTPTGAVHVNTTTATVTLLVQKATPDVQWTAPAAIVGGTPLGAAQLNATASVPGTFTYTPAAGTVPGVGANQTLSLTFTPADAANYTTATASVALTVTSPNHAPVVVNPGNQSNTDSSPYFEYAMSDSPAAYWRLGELSGSVLSDSVGASPGTLFGGVTRGASGALSDGNASMRFDGSTAYARVPSTPSLQLAGDLTIEMWIYPSLATRQTLISKDYLREFELTLETTGSLNLYQGNGTSYSNVWSPHGSLVANAWQHIAVTRTAATKTTRFYVNGVEVGSGTYTYAAAASTTAVSIGRNNGSKQYTNGWIDELALYPAPLTAAQVQAHYARRVALGRTVSLPLVASDPDGNPLTFSATGLPAGVTINPSTGLMSGTLSAASVGSHTVNASASDGQATVGATFTWTVTHINQAPRVTNPGSQASVAGSIVSLPVGATDADGDTLTFSATGLPAGYAIGSASGAISGGPIAAGTYLVTVSASDGQAVDRQTFAWTSTHVNRKPVLASVGPQSTSATSSYADSIMADSPVAYWRFGEASGTTAQDSAGANPGTWFGGITLGQPGGVAGGDTAARFNGSTGGLAVPGASALSLAGNLTIEMWVNLSLAARQTLISKDYLHEFELTLETSGALNLYQGNGLSMSNVRSTQGAVTANTWQHIVVTRTAATKTIAFYVNGVAKSGGVSSVVPAVGGEMIYVGQTVGGGQRVNGLVDEVALYATTLSGEQAAAHYTRRTLTGTGNVVSLRVSATDADGDTITYAATGLPTTLTIDPGTGVIGGTLDPSNAGSYNVTVTASDGSLTDSQTFSWTITHAGSGPGGPVATFSYPQTIAADAPTAYWRLGETTGTVATDGAGTNQGALIGGAIPGQPGALSDGNTAVGIDGATGFVQVVNAPALQLAGDLTIEMWVNVSLASRQTLISKDYLREFELTLETSGALNLYQGTGSGYTNVRSATSLVAAHAWQHIVVTREAATRTVRFYVNGLARGSGTYTGDPIAGTRSVYIGRSGSAQFVNGTLDEVALYRGVLTPAQIATHFGRRTWTP